MALYAAARLSFDVIYWVGRCTVDGAYYMMYGHQETTEEKILKENQTLKQELEAISLKQRKTEQILEALAKKNGIDIPEPVKEVDEETLLLT